MQETSRAQEATDAGAQVASELGRRIRTLRVTHGLTQEELALLSGVSVRFVGDLERGKPTVRLSGVLAVCHVLGLAVLPS